jgi:aminoglycoside phosphotransferase (APT) family kinase protein
MDEYFDSLPQVAAPAIESALAEAGITLSERAGCKLLSGGFQNWNFLVRQHRGAFVLRVAKSADVLMKEVQLLASMEKQCVAFPIPKVLWARIESDSTPIAAFSFMPGEMLWNCRPRFDECDRDTVSFQLGTILAQIHTRKYRSFGFLDANLNVSSPVESFSEWVIDYMRSCLASSRFCSRVHRDLRKRLLECIDAHPEFHSAESEPCLCHGDFNEKNILIGLDGTKGPIVSAVLDWEYALVSTPSVDVGNLFRFSAIDPWVNEKAFEAGYLDAGGKLAVDWRPRACFIDLIALCHFLDSKDERPKTHATALRMIDDSLDYLNFAI